MIVQTFFRRFYVLLLAGVVVIIAWSGCSKTSFAPFSPIKGSNSWQLLLPGDALAVYMPPENQSLTTFLQSGSAPTLDDLTSTSFSLLAQIRSFSQDSLYPKAVIIYPDQASGWQPAWVFPKQDGHGVWLDELRSRYHETFNQNHYLFQKTLIEKFPVSGRNLFIAEEGPWLMVSESGLALEAMIRAKSDPGFRWVQEHDEGAVTGVVSDEWMINPNTMDLWVQQWAKTIYRPALKGFLEGTAAFRMKSALYPDERVQWAASGSMMLKEDPSLLLRGISGADEPFGIDRYISDKAAAFSMLRLTPRRLAPLDAVPVTRADSLLTGRPDLWRELAETLDEELAVVFFADSGPSSSSEILWLRRLNNRAAFREVMEQLVAEGAAEKSGDSWLLEGRVTGDLIASGLQPFDVYSLSEAGGVVALAARKGLAESVRSDASRRRVMLFDDDYMEIRRARGETFSSFTYLNAEAFRSFITPWMFGGSYADRFLSGLDLLTVSTRSSGSRVDVDVVSVQREEKEVPFEEQWVYPVAGSALTGTPVAADLSGSPRDELLFATDNRALYLLASDGTLILQLSTGEQVPVGSPVVTDWYGNNQLVIMQAAGDRIFAWNTSGTMLPNFPVVLDEQITTPLTVRDITRNGILDMVVATADRAVHILNSRGEPVENWPQMVNAVVQDPPRIESYGGEQVVFAVSENILHAWRTDGRTVDGFPLFLDAAIAGPPLWVSDSDGPGGASNAGGAEDDGRAEQTGRAGTGGGHLLLSSRDGHLLAVGKTPFFPDTSATRIRSDSLIIQSLNVTPSGLHQAPQKITATLYEDGTYERTSLLLLLGTNGSVFLYDFTGRLRFSRSMGQPASASFSPVVTDINRDQRVEVLALADFGRLYGWDLLTGERLYDLPTSGMTYPLITDLNGDGLVEWVAGTRGGLRAWTIYPFQGEFGTGSGSE